ncbi:MAG: ArsR/SmtB family transcription factor [Longimicrobiales bacterium]
MEEPLSVVAEPRRREILHLVWEEERSAGEIAAQLPVSFSAVSQHLAKLREAGLVAVRKDGRRRLYRARKGHMGTLGIYLESMWRDKLQDLKTLAERKEALDAED